MRTLHFTVLLRRDEDDGSVLRASVPGLAGSVSGFEREHEAVAAVRLALSELVQGLGPEEIEQVLAAQAEVVPGDLPRGTRLVRVSVEAPSYEVPRAAAGG